MNKTDKNNGTPVKVVDITGKLCDFITLKEFMKRTALIDTGIISQAEIDSNEWLTIDEAERETIESIRQQRVRSWLALPYVPGRPGCLNRRKREARHPCR